MADKPRPRRSGHLPSFSVIVPTYQRRDVAAAAVEALCRLDYPGSVELVVVVDGSTDGSADALRAIACPFPVHVVEQPNSGAAAARNRGAALAGGDILLFLDDDMICEPDMLRHHAGSYDEGADAVLGDIPLDPASPPGFLSRSVGRWAAERSAALAAGKPLELGDLLTGQLSVKRAVFEQLGGFDAQFTANGNFGNEDLDFGIRLLANHDVRFNPLAISRQRYVVQADQHLRQWHDAGQADVALARKHPERTNEVFAGRRLRVIGPLLAAVPGLPWLAGRTAARLAELAPGEGPIARVVQRCFMFARDLAYWHGVARAGGVPSSSRALVLCYHAMSDLSADPVLADYGIGRAAFAAQLDLLARRGFHFVHPRELRSAIEGRARLPRRAVVLSFDDCYTDLLDVAREELRPRGIPALAFAVTGLRSNEWDQPIGAARLELLGASGLRSLGECGVEVGCHSRSHRSLTELGDEDLAAETAGSAADLEAAGLPRPTAFAYPYGVRDARCGRAVKDAGFALAFGLRRGRAGPGCDPFDLPRVEILARDTGWRFRAKTAFPRLSAILR